MNRTKGILAAGTFTGLILITILALGFGSLQASSAEKGVDMPTTAEIAPPAVDNLNAEAALQEWQAYSAELEQTILTLQARDAAYQEQLDAANETILSLQDDINAANSAPVYEEHEEHEQHESEEHEYGEYDD